MNNKPSVNEYNISIWSRDFTLLFFSNFFLTFGANMLMPVLPVYMYQAGGNSFQIGMVMGSFTVSAIIMRLFSVRITALLGKRVFLMIGLLLCAMSAGGYYLTTLFLVIFMLRVLHGFGFGATTTLYGAIVSNIIPKSRMGEGMGYFGLCVVIASAIGPFLGAMIVLLPKYHWVFLLSSGLILLSMALTRISKAGRERVEKTKGPAAKFSLLDFFEIKVVFPSILAFFMGISMAGMFIFIVLFGKEVKIEGIGVFFLFTSFAELAVRPVSGRLYDRSGPLMVLIPGGLAGFASTILLSYSTNIPMLITSAVLYGIGLGTVFPVLQAWALRSIDSGRRVAATATFYNFVDSGVALGSLTLGLVAKATSYATMYRYTSLTFALFITIYLIYFINRRRRGFKF
jgi:MFS family permease